MKSQIVPHSRKNSEIQVVGAAIWNGVDHILIAERSLAEVGGQTWEFPGGKVEHGESLEQALHREIREELDIEIEILQPLGESTFQNKGKFYRLHLFLARWLNGVPRAIEHNKIQWTRTFSSAEYRWSSADVPFLEPVATLLQDICNKN